MEAAVTALVGKENLASQADSCDALGAAAVNRLVCVANRDQKPRSAQPRRLPQVA